MGGTHKNPYKLTKALTKKSYGYRALRIVPSNEKREKIGKIIFLTTCTKIVCMYLRHNYEPLPNKSE